MRRIFHRNAIDYVLTFARFAHFRQANAGKRPNCPNKLPLLWNFPGKVKEIDGSFAQKQELSVKTAHFQPCQWLILAQKNSARIRAETAATEEVSRVLLLRQSILAGRRRRCSVPPFGTAGPTITSRSVLHRVGFTWPPGLPDAGELLPRLSILTAFAAVSFCCTGPGVASACR